MALNVLTKENCTRITSGSPNRVLLAALYTGLGTAMHALPAIASMIADGYEVTVNCKEFQRPIYEAVGCKTICIREPFGLSWYQEHESEYGRIISLHAWDLWDLRQFGKNLTGTMETFAGILGSVLPEQFSWIEVLKPEFIPGDYILFAPNSLEKWRSLPKETADKIDEELQQFGDVIRIQGSECPNWDELKNLIFNASIIVAVEGGISNVAGAFGKTMLVTTGMTEVETTIEQYRRYIPNLLFREVRGFVPEGCSMPCLRQKSRGFINDKCLGKNNLPECLAKIDIAKVIHEFSLLQRG